MNSSQRRGRRLFLLAATLAATALGGCASKPEIRHDQDAGVDLASYRTYAFFEPLSTDSPRYGSLLSDETLANPGPAIDMLVGEIFAGYTPLASAH